MGKEYLVEGAKLICINGDKPCYLKVSNGRRYKSGGRNKANCLDCKEGINISCFGKCKKNQKTHMCEGFMKLDNKWINTKPSLVKVEKINGQDAIDMNNVLICKRGGIIIPVTSGQGYEKRIDWEVLKKRFQKIYRWISGKNLVFQICKEDPINMNTGNYIYEYEDLYIPGINRIFFRMFYNSMEKDNEGCLGKGWHHNYEIRIEKNPDTKQLMIYTGEGKQILFNSALTGIYYSVFGDRELLESDEQGYTYHLLNESRLIFDLEGKLVAQIDKNNNKNIFKYNKKGLLSEVIGTNGGKLFYEYNSENSLIRVRDNIGRKIIFNYSYRKLLKFVNSSGCIYNYEYNENCKLDVISVQGLLCVKNEYDAADRILKQTLADGSYIEMDYDDLNNRTYLRERNGNIIIYESDEKCRNRKTIYQDGEEVYEYNKQNQRTHYIDKLGNETHYRYDDRGNLIEVKNALGYKSHMKYDEKNHLICIEMADGSKEWKFYDDNGNIIKKIDALGYETLISYQDKGLPEKVILPDQSKIFFQYDDRGNVIRCTNSLGNEIIYQYNELNKVISMTDGNGFTTKYFYDFAGRIKEIENALGEKSEFIYDERGRLIEVSDSNKQVQKQRFNEMGEVSQTIDALGNKTEYEYNNIGKISKKINPNGSVELFSYDKYSRLHKIENTYGAQIQYYYDLMGNCIKMIGPNNESFEMEYDKLNRCIKIIQNESKILTYNYDSRGLIKEISDENGKFSYQYNALGKLIAVENDKGERTEYAYNEIGKIIEVKNDIGNKVKFKYFPGGLLKSILYPNKQEIHFKYDHNENVIEKSDLDGGVSYYKYDCLNRLIQIKNTKGEEIVYEYLPSLVTMKIKETPQSVSQYLYSDGGKLNKVIDAEGTITEIEYDSMGRLLRVFQSEKNLESEYEAINDINKQQKKAQVRYERDLLGRIISKIDALGREERFDLDFSGRIVKRVDQEGNIIRYEYCNDGKVKSVLFKDNNRAEYIYNRDGKLIKFSDWNGENIIERDKEGRIVSVIDYNGKKISYAYNESGKRECIIYPDGRNVQYEYNEKGRLIQLICDKEYILYFYDDADRLSRKQYSNGISTEYKYNSDGRILKLIHVDGTSIIEQYLFYYNSSGYISEIEKRGRKLGNDAGKYRYVYDIFGRLSKIFKDNKFIRGYEYDVNGNRIKKIDGESVTSYKYDSANQLLEMNTQYKHYEYRYDNRGNLTEICENGMMTYRFTFNAMNQLSEVYDRKGKKCVYTYNALGFRVESKERADDNIDTWSKKIYCIDIDRKCNNLLCIEGEENLNIIWDDGVAGLKSGENFQFYLRDNLESPICLMGKNGNILEKYSYDEFGNITGDKKQLFGFAGYIVEGIPNMYYVQVREYMANIGRFISVDQYKGNINAPITLNEYAYCMNNPVMLVDRNGLTAIDSGLNQLDVFDVFEDFKHKANSLKYEAHKKYIELSAEIKEKASELEQQLKGLNDTAYEP